MPPGQPKVSIPRFIVSSNGEVSAAVAGPDDVLVLPGFVNAHSHAFQRCLRGRVELRGAGDDAHDDFWSWRAAMYDAAQRLTPDDVRALSAWAFLDMLGAGYTAVGEFHYLHHDERGPLVLSRAVADAARSVGMRLVLLETAYARAGFDAEGPLPHQARFAFPDVDTFLQHAEASRDALSDDAVSVGLAVHSVRACPPSWIEAVAERARSWGSPLHVHACEQLAEVEACQKATGLSPIFLLDRCGALGPTTTVVHGTHLDDDDIVLLGQRQAMVCVTPSTERNLGDGLCRIADLVAAGVGVCIGSDSHARIDAVDELRSLEDHERLRTRRRNVLTAPGQRLARALIPAGTAVGARSLGLPVPVGVVSVPMPVEGVAGGDVGLDAFLVGGSSADVDFVMGYSGRVLVNKGAPENGLHHRLRPDIIAEATAVLRRLASES